MKIVILDSVTIAVGNEINFSGFAKLGNLEIHANLADPQQIISALTGAEVVVLNKVNFNAQLIAVLPATLKLIAICATGYDNVDVAAASLRGIKVVNAPEYGSRAVAQLTFMFILNCANQFVRQHQHRLEHGWERQAGLAIPMHELSGKTLGIIGLGAIGLSVAKLGLAFGMRVVAYSRSNKEIEGVEQISLLELALQSDFISLHCPLSAATRQIINQDFLARVKPGSYLINTARGGLVDEDALISALDEGRIAGAALDVLNSEPPLERNRLLNLANVILTPHIAWAPIEARQRCVDIVVANIAAYQTGVPTNLLN